MNLYYCKSKFSGLPIKPETLLNIDTIFDIKKVVSEDNSVLKINRFINSEKIPIKINSNDIWLIDKNGFTVFWNQGDIYYILFDLEKIDLSFKRDFKIKKILNI